MQNEQVERRKKCVVPVKLKLQTHSTTILQSSIHTIYISDAYKMLSLFGGQQRARCLLESGGHVVSMRTSQTPVRHLTLGTDVPRACGGLGSSFLVCLFSQGDE